MNFLCLWLVCFAAFLRYTVPFLVVPHCVQWSLSTCRVYLYSLPTSVENTCRVYLPLWRIPVKSTYPWRVSTSGAVVRSMVYFLWSLHALALK